MRSVTGGLARADLHGRAQTRGCDIAAGLDTRYSVTMSAAKRPRNAPASAKKPGARSTGTGKAKRSLTRRVLRFLVLAALVLIAIPIVLVPVYAVVPPPFSTLELWQRVMGKPVEGSWVPMDDIAPNLGYAVLMAEDGKFCAHNGVDWSAVRQVIDSDSARGASTITMQIAKNLFLWPSRSYLRKGLEVPLAYWMNVVWTKRRTLEIYLNIVEWGPGVFGAEAAAQHWFNVSAARLTIRQAALLAAILPNPVERSASRPGPFTNRYAGTIERRTRQAGDYVRCIRPKS